VIASLAGRIEAVGADHAVVDVNGVGYLVFASGRTLSRLPEPGGSARLLIETHVREDHIHLYGFADIGERDWFRLLTTVQGVGARTAIAILSALAPDDLTLAVAAQDKAVLTRAEGVGTKLATRIVTELRDRAGDLALAAGKAAGAHPATGPAPSGRAAEQAVSALVNLQYSQGEAFGAVNRAVQSLGADAPVDALIKAALKELAA
jgi:Holliday junction DNA helicase RuvA